MSLKIMIRNTLLGNEGITPRAKGVQAVSVSKIREGHVSKISQSLQSASSSLEVRPGLIVGQNLSEEPFLKERKRECACPGILPSPTKISRERLGRKGTCPKQYIY
jgi:hypothetical protein